MRVGRATEPAAGSDGASHPQVRHVAAQERPTATPPQKPGRWVGAWALSARVGDLAGEQDEPGVDVADQVEEGSIRSDRHCRLHR